MGRLTGLGEHTDRGPVLSYHPGVEGDLFCWERGSVDLEELDRIRRARAVILPPTVSREFYYLVRHHCKAVFPNYDLRFQWEGKVGDAMLFWSYGAPHPKTRIYPRVEALVQSHPVMGYHTKAPDFPCVVKASTGGEGVYTWLVRKQDELDDVVHRLKALELERWYGFVVQEYLPGLERDLRVVVIGEEIRSYWRVNPGFHKNVARGGEIDVESDPELQAIGRKAVAELCRCTGIDLAGFDLVFPEGKNVPLFLEINYTFGLSGLGGMQGYQSLLQKAVARWLAQLE